MVSSTGDTQEEGGVLTGGASLEEASGAIILLHGRGGSAAEMIALGREIALRGLALLAPQASERTWYPHAFLAPIQINEPWLTSAMNKVTHLLELCADFAIPATRTAIVGFSQGACLATEFVARHPKRYGAVIALTGGLLGPLGSDLAHPGSLEGTPTLLSSGDPDPYIPWSRVEETGRQFQLMDASVEIKKYPGRAHTVVPEELDAAQKLLCFTLQR
jgi:phospholipase/carboxylesterase